MVGITTHTDLEVEVLLEPCLLGAANSRGQVVMVNDDYTPMEYVVKVLIEIFGLDHRRAVDIMLRVHYEGQGLCGEFPVDIAKTKAAKVALIASKKGYPLFCRVDVI